MRQIAYLSNDIPFKYRRTLQESLNRLRLCWNNENYLAKVVKMENHWEYLDGMNPDVANVIANADRLIEIKTYHKRFSRALAYTYKGSDVIHINTAKIDRSFSSISGTFAHEIMHCYGYGHGNNSRKGKQNSPPYWVGSSTMDFIDNSPIETPKKPSKKYLPWYKRIFK